MSTLPPVVRVGQSQYAVVLRRMDGMFGETDKYKHELHIHPQQAPASMRDTVMHETLHAVFHESGAGSVLDIGSAVEEKLICLLAPWVLMLLRDNPELVDYLTRDGYDVAAPARVED